MRSKAAGRLYPKPGCWRKVDGRWMDDKPPGAASCKSRPVRLHAKPPGSVRNAAGLRSLRGPGGKHRPLCVRYEADAVLKEGSGRYRMLRANRPLRGRSACCCAFSERRDLAASRLISLITANTSSSLTISVLLHNHDSYAEAHLSMSCFTYRGGHATMCA